MSESKPTVAKEEALVNSCPLCGANFLEPLITNVKHVCPIDGGCGKSFLVRTY